jgi:hypothetical protein
VEWVSGIVDEEEDMVAVLCEHNEEGEGVPVEDWTWRWIDFVRVCCSA